MGSRAGASWREAASGSPASAWWWQAAVGSTPAGPGGRRQSGGRIRGRWCRGGRIPGRERCDDQIWERWQLVPGEEEGEAAHADPPNSQKMRTLFLGGGAP